VTLVGVSGRLRVLDHGFEWVGPDGRIVDEMRAGDSASGLEGAAAAMADALGRLMDDAIPSPAPTDHAAVLSMAQALLLSTRTGEAESPGTIRRMMGAA
jgi:hypothetical protein